MTNFKGKTIFIAGASSDIGLASAEALSNDGAELILHFASLEGLERLKAKFPDTKHEFVQMNFGEVDKIEENLGIRFKNKPLDGLINCVGVRSRRPLKLLKHNHVLEVMTLNYFSFIELLRVALKKGCYNSGFSVVQVSSIAAQTGGSAVTAYAASKAASDAAIRSLAKELVSKGVRLNSVVCGQVESRAYSKLLEVNKEDKVLDRQYLGLLKTSEVADIILFLLSEKAKRISGSFIPADGGYLQ
jgi:NAD(P)-dependent dehydrogenase (short-subunit alcohol dehydrogenase family)